MTGLPFIEKRSSRVLLIIPAYNEQATIGRVIEEIRKTDIQTSILVINDASTDATSQVVRNLSVPIVELPFNLGIGGAVQTGLKIAEELGYDIAVQVDADGQHDPNFIKDLVTPLIEGRADISVGSRQLFGDNPKSSLTRNAGIRFFSWLTSKIISQKVTDCSSGFRALNRRAMHLFAAEYPVDFPDAEALVLGHKAGLRICEIAVRFRARNGGASSLRRWRIIYYPFKEALSIAMLMTRKSSEAA